MQSDVSQKEKNQISYINSYIWNQEKWYSWTYFHGRNGDLDIENGLVDTLAEEESVTNGESSIDMCTLLLLLLSRFSRVRLCVTPQTAAHETPPSLGLSRQEHWSGLPFPSPMHESEKWKWSCSVVSNPEQPHGLQPTRLLLPWDFPGKSTE